MDINLLGMSLRNFKGAQKRDVEFARDTRIYGTNETGKTTLFDAFLWTLFGKDSLNRADFDVKGLDGQGKAAPNLDHSVDMTLDIDGRSVVLTRVLSEVWTKKRGAPRKEFTGHTTAYNFDGVPVSEKEYQERIKGLIDEKVFRLLTDPRYFNEVLSWQDRRKLLMEVCGKVSIEDVIAYNKKLSGLSGILNGHGVEDFKKVVAAEKRKINDELERIPVRIDEATRSLVEIRPDINQVPGMIDALDKKKEGLEAQLADVRNGGAVSAKRIELQDIEGEILRTRNAFGAEKNSRIDAIIKDLTPLQDLEREAITGVKDKAAEIESKKRSLESMEKETTALRGAWHAIDDQAFIPPASDKCPNCGHVLNQKAIDDARERFMNQKASQLAAIDMKGKDLMSNIEACRSQIAQATASMEELRGKIGAHTDRINALTEQIGSIRAEKPDTTALDEKKAAIQAEIDNIQGTEQTTIQKLQGQISEVKQELQALVNDHAKVGRNKETQQRIEDLAAQEKDLAAQFEALESKLRLVEDFERSKAELLDKKINEKFKVVSFKLFRDQLNEGLQEMCETTVKGVPYRSMNNAARIQAGLDIINTLQAHYGVTAPVWIDNREAVVEIPEMNCQTISLIVSEADKTLRVAA